jgi:FG-GAP-like repeat
MNITRCSLRLLLPTSLLGLAICASVPLMSWKKQIITKDFISEGVAVSDLDGDGVRDLIAGHLWFKGPDFTTAIQYRPGKVHSIDGYIEDSFINWAEDLNGDKTNDLLMVGWPGKQISLYLNPGKIGEEWKAYQIITEAATESPIWIDLTGDQKKEIVCMQQGKFGYYSANWSDVTKPWTFTAISEKRSNSPYVHGLGAGDLNNDGKPDIIEKDGWFEQPATLPGTWTHHKFSQQCRGGSQMLVHDFDSDGDNDVVTSLDGHGYGLGWYENEGKEKSFNFIYHEILPADAQKKGANDLQFSQLHSLAMADFDKDGRMDFVTGKRYWAHGNKDPGSLDPALTVIFYNRKEGDTIKWESSIIDQDGGVGCDVVATDLNNDAKVDVAVGSKKGVFVIRQ